MSKERFNRVMSDVNRMIFDLVHSSDPNEKMGGIVIIGAFGNCIPRMGPILISFAHALRCQLAP
jgi:hypothetical protein